MINRSLLSVLLLFCSSISVTAGTSPMLQKYLDGMKLMVRNCSMDYSATTTYPGNVIIAVNGRMAMSEGNYYDSSNSRFVLMNKSWLIAADHQEKVVSTLYLPEWRKEMGKDFELDISGFLFPGMDLSGFSGFDLKPVGEDSFRVYVQYKLEGDQTLELSLLYPKNGVVPAYYKGTISYPMADAESEMYGKRGMVTVKFECSHIVQAAPSGLFDDARLIRQSGKNARLLRFNNYKMYKKSR